MLPTIASLINMFALLAYVVVAILLVAQLVIPAIWVLLIGQFLETIHRWIKTDLE